MIAYISALTISDVTEVLSSLVTKYGKATAAGILRKHARNGVVTVNGSELVLNCLDGEIVFNTESGTFAA